MTTAALSSRSQWLIRLSRHTPCPVAKAILRARGALALKAAIRANREGR